MALNIDTQDIDAYPGTVKRVTVDQSAIVPAGFEGDEQYVITVGTSSYSDNTLRTAISDIYVTDFIAGWCKSSGFSGSSGKYNLSASVNTFRIKMDATVSGVNDSEYYDVTLDYDASARSGALVAQDMEEKIRALPAGGTWNASDTPYALAYTNCSVEYTDGKFWITSGSIGRYYTGTYRSSVKVLPGLTNDCTVELGFDLSIDSQTIAGYTYPEALVSSTYSPNTTPLSVQAGSGVSQGDGLMITNGTDIEYFTALSGTTDTSIVVPITSSEGYTGITNTYSGTVSKIQIMRPQDPDNAPKPWFSDVDQLIRYGIKSIVNQIDYSS